MLALSLSRGVFSNSWPGAMLALSLSRGVFSNSWLIFPARWLSSLPSPRVDSPFGLGWVYPARLARVDYTSTFSLRAISSPSPSSRGSIQTPGYIPARRGWVDSSLQSPGSGSGIFKLLARAVSSPSIFLAGSSQIPGSGCLFLLLARAVSLLPLPPGSLPARAGSFCLYHAGLAFSTMLGSLSLPSLAGSSFLRAGSPSGQPSRAGSGSGCLFSRGSLLPIQTPAPGSILPSRLALLSTLFSLLAISMVALARVDSTSAFPLPSRAGWLSLRAVSSPFSRGYWLSSPFSRG